MQQQVARSTTTTASDDDDDIEVDARAHSACELQPYNPPCARACERAGVLWRSARASTAAALPIRAPRLLFLAAHGGERASGRAGERSFRLAFRRWPAGASFVFGHRQLRQRRRRQRQRRRQRPWQRP